MAPRRRPTHPPTNGPSVELPATVTGEVELLGRVPYLRPDLQGWSDLLPLERVSGERPAAGDAVIAELQPLPPGSHHAALPFARLVRILGPAGEPATEVARILTTHGIAEEHGAAALEEAAGLDAGIEAALAGGREDLRELPLVTIDGEDAKDFDDAVYVEEDGDGHVVWVAIADVAHYVPEGGALDGEAFARGTSVYLPGRCVPMLPARLSEGLCSLRPREERLAMVARLAVAADGEVTDARFSEAVIRSQDRLTYAQVQATLDGDRAAAGPAWTHEDALQRLAGVAARLQARGREAGALDLNVPEAEVLLDDTGAVTGVRRRPRQASHRLIEQAMLAANGAVGRHLATLGHPCIYRVHAPPTEQRIEDLARVAAAHGFELKVGSSGTVSPAALGRLLEAAADSRFGPALHALALRTLTRAEYATNDIGHFGLAMSSYLHFTSPIRRYPDLVVHRLLKGLLAAEKTPTADLGAVATRCSETERRAMTAEFAALDLYRCLAVTGRVGDSFDGTVASVAPFGLFVTLDDPYVEGLVHVSDLGPEWFDLDQDRLELVARRSGLRYGLCDPLRVRIARVDVRQRKIGFFPDETDE